MPKKTVKFEYKNNRCHCRIKVYEDDGPISAVMCKKSHPYSCSSFPGHTWFIIKVGPWERIRQQPFYR